MNRCCFVSIALCILGCAPHAEPPPTQTSAESTDADVDEQLAVSITRATLGDCMEDTFTAELKHWDGHDWWNVACQRSATPTSIAYGSLWVRKSDGRQHYGASWTESTRPEWVRGVKHLPNTLARHIAKNRLGPDRDIGCSAGRRHLHAFDFHCWDHDTGENWDVRVDPDAATAEVGPSTLLARATELQALAHPPTDAPTTRGEKASTPAARHGVGHDAPARNE